MTVIDSPSPDSYNLPAFLDVNQTTSLFTNHVRGNKTYAFGAGREDFAKTVVNDKKYPDPDVPGPGMYRSIREFGVNDKSGPKIKGKLRNGTPEKEALKAAIPGVGTYKDTT